MNLLTFNTSPELKSMLRQSQIEFVCFPIFVSNENLKKKKNETESAPSTKKRISARTEWQINNMDLTEHLSMQQHKQREQSTPSSSSSSSQHQHQQHQQQQQQASSHASSSRHFSSRKRRCPSAEIKRTAASPLSLDNRSDISASPAPQSDSA